MPSIATASSFAALGQGDEAVCVAILDGPVEVTHPCFRGARLTTLQTSTGSVSRAGRALAHGTHVASMIFGQPDSAVPGVAPLCRGLIIPIFTDESSGEVLGCSQLELARAILMAVENGAHIVNISGGQLAPSAEPEPFLAQAIDSCVKHNVLIVAAAGNDGCECLHVPAAARSVIAVGAMDDEGNPMPSSNWGTAYRDHGILAPGKDVLGAAPDGGTAHQTGTSFAAPLVSGLAALLAVLQVSRGRAPDPRAVRSALLKSAVPCLPGLAHDCRRFLSGSLNVEGAIELIKRGDKIMTEQETLAPSEASSRVPEKPLGAPLTMLPSAASAIEVGQVRASEDATSASASYESPAQRLRDQINPSDCGCGGGAPTKPTIVYALGKLGYDFGSEARRDSFVQTMPAGENNPTLPDHLLAHLDAQPHDAASIIWTLNLDATPIYAIQPAGPFAAGGYDRLREFLHGQQREGVELVSIPGVIGGSARLQSGQVLPVVVPALRGMFSWATAPLAAHVLGVQPESVEALESYNAQLSGLTDFLDRVYYDLRNLGVTAEERAINYSATNALQVAEVIRSTTQQRLDLDSVDVRKSPVCRPDSDCYDVELSFFDPDNTNVASRIFRFTVDVSDVVPVTIGSVRSWTRRK